MNDDCIDKYGVYIRLEYLQDFPQPLAIKMITTPRAIIHRMSTGQNQIAPPTPPSEQVERGFKENER